MKNEALYRKTVDILYQAYFNDTLEHLNCSACAVGNIIAANMGIKFISLEPPYSVRWMWVDKHGNNVHRDWWHYIKYGGSDADSASAQIQSTGYSSEQLNKIEEAFEHCARGESPEDYMFNGLVAVLAVLDEIHEVTDSTEVERFEKHYQTRKSLAL